MGNFLLESTMICMLEIIIHTIDVVINNRLLALYSRMPIAEHKDASINI